MLYLLMELKNLLTKLKNKQEKSEHFFALEIDHDSVKSAVWTVIAGQTKISKIGTVESWDGTKPKNLLTAVDKSISSASENIEPEPTGVIFGLPESWTNQANISSDKKKYLKNICQQLELKPLGFVITSTALTQYLKIQEGTPPTAIFLQIESGELNLILVKLGKIIGSELVGRSEDLGADVEEGLSRFKKIDTLPARMILFDGQLDFEEAKQQLISYDWQERLPFIHFPKVEILSSDISIKAIALAGGSEVAKSLGFEIKSPLKQPSSTPSHRSKKPESEIAIKPTVARSLTAADSGFILNQDIVDRLEPKPSPSQLKSKSTASTSSTAKSESQSKTPPTSSFIFNLTNIIKRIINKLFSHFQLLFRNKNKRFKHPLVLVSLGFSSLFLILFLLYWFLPKATVILYFEPKTIYQDLELTVDPQATDINLEKAIIPGKTFNISVEDEKTIPTTGITLVGEPAKGSISVFNKTSSTKTFVGGTVLIGPNNLVFVLDEDTTVASSSSTVDENFIETITPGRTQASITAKSIGPEGNLAGNSQLSFQQYAASDFSAKTDAGLSGGTAREVKAVSEQDQNHLLQILANELQLKAQEQLQLQMNSDIALVEINVQEQLTSKQFNHNLDEEADNLTLRAKLEYPALGYHQKDLSLLLQQLTKEKIPQEFQLSDTGEIDMEPAQIKKNNAATIQISYTAYFVPKLDFVEIKENLAGRYPATTQKYLGSLPSFIRADIAIVPNLPVKLKTLPRITKNILVELKIAD